MFKNKKLSKVQVMHILTLFSTLFVKTGFAGTRLVRSCSTSSLPITTSTSSIQRDTENKSNESSSILKYTKNIILLGTVGGAALGGGVGAKMAGKPGALLGALGGGVLGALGGAAAEALKATKKRAEYLINKKTTTETNLTNEPSSDSSVLSEIVKKNIPKSKSYPSLSEFKPLTMLHYHHRHHHHHQLPQGLYQKMILHC